MKPTVLILFTAFGAISVFGFLALSLGMNSDGAHVGCLAEMANGYACPNSGIFDFASYHLSFLNKFVLSLALSFVILVAYIAVRFYNSSDESFLNEFRRFSPVFNFRLPRSEFLSRISLFTNSPNF